VVGAIGSLTDFRKRQTVILEMAQTDVISSAHCTHCGALNTFPGMSSVEAFICSKCGEGVALATPVQ
jgi:hypothetical protein